MDLLIPFGLVLMGLVGMALYVVTAALRDALRRIAEINDQLLLLVGLDKHGEAAARALIAKAQVPKRPIPPAEAEKKLERKPEKKPGGVIMTYGAK